MARILIACEQQLQLFPELPLPHTVRATRKREYKARWIAAHPDRARLYSRRWTTANRTQRQAIVDDWRRRNPEKVRAMSARAGAKWSQGKGRGKRNALTRKRVAAKLNRTAPWADLSAIAAFYEEAARLSVETGVPHEVDHIVPLQGETVSGLHVHNNLQVISRFANRSKRNRFGGSPPSEF